MKLCDDYGPFDFRSPCIRASWSAFLPAALVFALCFRSIPVPRPVQHLIGILGAPFKSFITLHAAEAVDVTAELGEATLEDEDTTDLAEVPKLVPVWGTVVFVFVGMLQTFYWVADGAYRLYNDQSNVWGGVFSFLVAISWTYTIVRPIALPTVTPPYDMFAIYLVLFFAAILQSGGVWFDHNILAMPYPSAFTIAGLIANLLTVFALLIVILSMPLAIQSNRVNKDEIGRSVSPEDYTSLWGWISFSWVYPLIHRGRYTTLNEQDVWNLSPTMQSLPVFAKFTSIQGTKLLWRLWKANSLDILLDFMLTFVTVVFNYASPFFLKRILDLGGEEHPTPESRTQAYIYAFLALAASVGKAQAEVQHFWFGRRAAERIRSELMASIYDKALKRKDFSGIVDEEKERESAKEPALNAAETNGSKRQAKAKKKENASNAAKADKPKAGADIGKILNLMAGDTNRVSQTIATLNFMYGAPFEIVFASIFLYRLLGFSAFAGFLVLVAGWPLNNIVARRSIRIQKGILAARDKRMSILNELIGAVKFIKFFAWEDHWIKRALDVREAEMKWMVKARVNSAIIYLLWACASIMVSIISFTAYVLQGNELDIPTAFTAIALFNMIRAPLNVIPGFIVQILQTGVALDRISVYLEEEEVTDQVSSLKKNHSEPLLRGAPDECLGLENASFKWNEITKQPEKKDTKVTDRPPSDSSNNEADTVTDDSVSMRSRADLGDRKFELRDLSIKFPEGKLTVVTGPTASGKTALLLSVLGELTFLSGRIIMSKEPTCIDEHGLMHCISYAAQTPWLRHQSIKENILFGYPYDEDRYNAVVECCALKPDLEILEDGDATEIGARGVNLSGGQKARVALARAIYARTKYVLLDDPLSAVDSHTSRFLYEHLLCGPLLANRTVVLVTHHIDLVLPGAYYLVRMLDGRIDTQGTVKDLREKGALEGTEQDASIDAYTEKEGASEEPSIDETMPEALKSAFAVKKPRKLVKDEHREVGGVKWSIYKSYLKASSYWTWVFLTILIVIIQFLSISEKLWINTWGEAYHVNGMEPFPSVYTFNTFASQERSSINHSLHHLHLSNYQTIPTSKGILDINWPNAGKHPLFYIGIYAAIGLASALASVLSVTAQYTGALRASRLLFRQLLVTVVRATFRFHDQPRVLALRHARPLIQRSQR